MKIEDEQLVGRRKRSRTAAWAGALACLPLAAAALHLPASAAPDYAGSLVKVVGNPQTGFHLIRNGKPYFIKGAGGSGPEGELASLGANSIRTWGADTVVSDLDRAQKHGLTVCEGIWLGHTEQGFDWSDPAQIEKQREEVRRAVLLGRDKPALLIWALGNEMEGYGKGDSPVIWGEIEHLAKMVKQLDPNHPVMTVVAEIGGDKVAAIDRYCPDVDIIGINSYGGGPSLAERYRAAGAVKPYVITEFGPPGVWELPKNPWGVADELTSTQKADAYRDTYTHSVLNQSLCLGSYAFTWGFKQEATATWYGMLLPDGDSLAAVDTMRDLWTGKDGGPNAPVIHSYALVGPDEIAPGATVHADLSVSDPQGDPLRYRWILRSDHNRISVGGQAQPAEEDYPSAIVASSDTGADVQMPTDPGGYRLYVYVSDREHQAAVANIPLDVLASSAAAVGARTIDAAMTRDPEERAHLPLTIYDNGRVSNIYYPSGYMGDTGAIKLDPLSTAVPGRVPGGTCLQCKFDSGSGWGGVVWQSPANDWGDAPGGRNLTGAKVLSFWARGADGGETVSFSFGLIGSDKKYHDTASGKLADVRLTAQWKRYSIDLSGLDMTRIKTPFCWVVAGSGAPTIFYLDDVRFE